MMCQCSYVAVKLLHCLDRTDLAKRQRFIRLLVWSTLMAAKSRLMVSMFLPYPCIVAPDLALDIYPQEVSIFRGLSVEDNISAILDVSEPDRHTRRERLEELLGEFSIEHLRRTSAVALSGGERRRVEIARALAAKPKYLLLDEPFAGVDPISVSDIRDLVSDLKTRGIGVLITDHNVRETLEIVDRAYILHDGKVLMSGTADEVVSDANVKRVYLGDNFKIV